MTSPEATKAEPYMTLYLKGKRREMETVDPRIPPRALDVDGMPKQSSAFRAIVEKFGSMDYVDFDALEPTIRESKADQKLPGLPPWVREAAAKHQETKPAAVHREKDTDAQQQHDNPTEATVAEDRDAWTLVNKYPGWTKVTHEQTSEKATADSDPEHEAESYVTVDPVTVGPVNKRYVPRVLERHTLRLIRGVVRDVKNGMAHDLVATKYFASKVETMVNVLAFFADERDKEVCRLVEERDRDGDGDGDWEMTTADDVGV